MIPGFQELFYPLLKIFEDGQVHKTSEIYEKVAENLKITREARNKYQPSGRQTVYRSRIGWARTYLYKAGLIEQVKRAHYQITEEGKRVLNNPSIKTIDYGFLRSYQSFRDFQRPKQRKEAITKEELSPEEEFIESYNQLKESVKNELLQLTLDSPPEFFEELVVKLLVEMGYGGTIEDAGEAIGTSGDEGIDGIIKEDILGLDMIYIQAKRWQGTVGRPEIQKFAGSLAGKKAQKGVFITTSDYSQGARKYVQDIAMNIILINGDELTEFMYKYNIGVTDKNTYILKDVNEAFFEV